MGNFVVNSLSAEPPLKMLPLKAEPYLAQSNTSPCLYTASSKTRDPEGE